MSSYERSSLHPRNQHHPFDGVKCNHINFDASFVSLPTGFNALGSGRSLNDSVRHVYAQGQIRSIHKDKLAEQMDTRDLYHLRGAKSSGNFSESFDAFWCCETGISAPRHQIKNTRTCMQIMTYRLLVDATLPDDESGSYP